jgi:hypothetical protein
MANAHPFAALIHMSVILAPPRRVSGTTPRLRAKAAFAEVRLLDMDEGNRVFLGFSHAAW